MGSLVLLDLIGGVALLLWGLHMVHSGVVRALGADLQRLLSVALGSRVKAFAAGLGVTALLQSSTATALMVNGFAAKGFVRLVPALAVMLGANVGTALIVQFLSLNISALAPILLVAGLIAFRRGQRTRVRDLGRVGIGLGLMLLSLHSLIVTLAPAENAPAVRSVVSAITGEPVLNVVLGAVLAWAAHSSVAVVMLAMSLGYSQFIMPTAMLALIVGANLGSAVNPVLEGAPAGNPAALRLPVGNLINRLVGCALVVPAIDPITRWLSAVDPSPVRMAADFHVMFNVALALMFILPLGGFARLLERLFPEGTRAQDPAAPLYLDPAAFSTPALALACAARETLHMGDIVEAMLRKTMTALMTNDRRLVAEISRMDNIVDRLHEAIKLYVIGVTRDSLEDREGKRAMEIISFAINLEHIGDIVDKNLMELAGKKIRRRFSFSPEGAAELQAMHRHVLDDLKLAFGIFVSGDVKMAQRLLEEKRKFREAEQTAAESHLARLREARPDSIETSALHIDVLRDLKRIHSHICAAAYPVLEGAGAGAASPAAGDIAQAGEQSHETAGDRGGGAAGDRVGADAGHPTGSSRPAS